jgi:hypothetical protein
MVEFGRFGSLADGRPIRLGGSVVDVLMAPIEPSGRWSWDQRRPAVRGARSAGCALKRGDRIRFLLPTLQGQHRGKPVECRNPVRGYRYGCR